VRGVSGPRAYEHLDAVEHKTGTKYVTYVVPGALMLCAGFGSATTAVSVTNDLTGGIIDRFRSMDIGATAVLNGHVAASAVRNTASTILVFGAVGVFTKTPEAAGGFTFFVMFVPYASSAFVPIDTMPSWLHGFVRNQPVTPVIETLRGLLLGQPVGTAPWLALSWCGGIVTVSVALAGVFFRRRTA
jgi:ABC-2 type transport system permease protein